ncbi:hypothetical protein [Fischerella thermalis]|nr:hypothetical protein [Fischerella thermalis]
MNEWEYKGLIFELTDFLKAASPASIPLVFTWAKTQVYADIYTEPV